MALFGKQKINANVNQWKLNYFQKLGLKGITKEERTKIQDIIDEVSIPFNIDNVDSMPSLDHDAAERPSVLTRLWLISRQNWMIIEQLSKMNQNIEKLIELNNRE